MSKNNNKLIFNNSFTSFNKFNSLSNTNIGLLSGNNIKTGSNNVTIGHKSLVKASTDKNSIVIGSDAIGQGDNIAVIGNTDIESIQSGTDGLCNLGQTNNTALESKNTELQNKIDNIMTILNNNNLS